MDILRATGLARDVSRGDNESVRLSSWCWGCVALLGLVFPLPGVADSLGAHSAARLEPLPSRSVGRPWAGHLRGGALLRESKTVRYLPKAATGGRFYGTRLLVHALERAAQRVERRWPGSQLSVGELSARRGGWVSGHHSHRTGRDADLAFYTRDKGGRHARLEAFVRFGRHAPLPPAQGVRFDDARNWELVTSLLEDPVARVQYLFVAHPIRARLLVEGNRRGASAKLLQAAAAVMVEPKRGRKHEDHFHLRIYCPAADRPECEDGAPYWPWYDAQPPGGRYAALPVIHWRVK